MPTNDTKSTPTPGTQAEADKTSAKQTTNAPAPGTPSRPSPAGTATTARTEAQEREEKAKHSAAVEAAQSVTEAVKRVADAAVAEVQKFQPLHDNRDFTFTGTRGGRFRIVGPSNLGSSGTVMLGGRQLSTRSWSTQEIEGDLPSDIPEGMVEVHIDPETVRYGNYFIG